MEKTADTAVVSKRKPIIFPAFFTPCAELFSLLMALTMDTNTSGTITSCKDLVKSEPTMPIHFLMEAPAPLAVSAPKMNCRAMPKAAPKIKASPTRAVKPSLPRRNAKSPKSTAKTARPRTTHRFVSVNIKTPFKTDFTRRL